MKVCMLALRTAAILMFLLPCMATAQTNPYTMEVVTGTTTSDGTPSLTIKAGSTGTGIVFIIPTSGFTDQISFSCVTPPANGTCTFNPNPLTPTGDPNSPSQVKLTFATTANYVARVSPSHKRWMLGSGALVCGVLLAVPFGTRRRKIAAVVLSLALLSCLGLAACGGGSSTSNTVKPGTYLIKIQSVSGSFTYPPVNMSVTVD